MNVSSVAGRVARKGAGVYNASKWAVNAFSESLRQEVTGRGVRIGLVEPGAVATELTDHITQPEAKAASKQMATMMTPLQSEDIARAVVYMVSQPPARRRQRDARAPHRPGALSPTAPSWLTAAWSWLTVDGEPGPWTIRSPDQHGSRQSWKTSMAAPISTSRS